MTKEWYDEHYHAQIDRRLSPWYLTLLDIYSQTRQAGPLVELGCGSAVFLEELVHRGLFEPDEVYGIEQSAKALEHLAGRLPFVSMGNLEAPLPFESGFAGSVVIAEVLEHLVDPLTVLGEARRILRRGGLLALSFPNYLNLPWLAVRILAELFDKPSWIVLQPIDRIYIYPVISKMLRSRSFDVRCVRGSVFFPPIAYAWEPRWFGVACNALRLGPLAFHPVIVAEAV